MSKQNPKEQSAYNNKFDGLMNAAPHKRYKSFAVTVADWESVWLDCDPNQPLPARTSRSSRWTCVTSATCWKRTRTPRFASSRTARTGRIRRRKICWRTCSKNSTGWSEGVANG